MTVLVTGGAGYVGINVVEALLAMQDAGFRPRLSYWRPMMIFPAGLKRTPDFWR